MKRRFEQKIGIVLIGILFLCGTLISKESDKKESERGLETSSKPAAQGCCRIKMAGGGYAYFMSTEEECAGHKQFHSFMKERTLCFESFPDRD
ncbi:hypothetical protein HGB47_10725 [Leptospira yasudae]|uniref:LIC_11321 family protein n=1 Tax=Leptospira yasudae TaxID=2202201 RepID=UPI001C4E8211|nr:hypothetical protein [Leptospira yasudae]MBW0434089.1 hypothetical protein [Leptospira yasudae]